NSSGRLKCPQPTSLASVITTSCIASPRTRSTASSTRRTKRQSRSTTRRSESAATGFMKWSPHATEAIRDLVERLAVVEREFKRPGEVRENRDRRQAWLDGGD